MGFTDLGAFGGEDIRTPTLDALAMRGIRFTNFHGHISCGPSRATLISGATIHEAGLGTQVEIPAFRGARNYELKTPYRDGTTHVIFEPVDFIAKLAALLPKPRVNLTRYHGVFAPNSKHRVWVTPARRGNGNWKVAAGQDENTPAQPMWR